MTNPDFSFVNEKGKRVSGTAAELNFIHTRLGGMDKFIELISKTAIERWVGENLAPISKDISKTAKKSRFRKVG